jgi:aldehyde dehydrogenase (NAD+)
VPIGDPLAEGVLVGPLIDGAAFESMTRALERAKADGGKVHGGGRALADRFPKAHYVHPAIVEMPGQSEIVCQETFAPILYAMKYRELVEAIELHNAVPQGLASCIFSTDVRETETSFGHRVGSRHRQCEYWAFGRGDRQFRRGEGNRRRTRIRADAWKGYGRPTPSIIRPCRWPRHQSRRGLS